MKGLGRLPAPDPRDANFRIAQLLTAAAFKLTPAQELALARGWQSWPAAAPYLDQGSKPHCVGFSFAHWLAAAPVVNRNITPSLASRIYTRAQQIDEFPGVNYDGTSVRAGAKTLREMRYLTEFRWGMTLGEVVNALLLYGPVVVGLNWYEGMDVPNTAHIMRAEGQVLGGHAFLLAGVDARPHRRVFRVKNSWGRAWADGGTALLPFADFERLLSEDGEACLAVEAQR